MTEATPRRRWARRLVGVTVLLVVVFYGGGGWYFSQQIHDQALSGEARRASTAFEPDTEVLAMNDRLPSITLAVGDEAGSLRTDGVFGLRWDGGYGRVAGILAEGGSSIERAFIHDEGRPPAVGDLAELDPRAFPEPEEGSVPEVAVEGPLGTYPAWFADGERDTWAIVAHGNALTRRDGLRMGPVLEASGLPTLWITYRNDAVAPADPSGLLRYGLTEWEDLQAAVAYALDQGAQEVVLIGYSMGGGIVMSFLQKSALVDAVRGVVLDSPMLDFSETVDDNASRETLPLVGIPLPSSLTAAAKWIADQRFDVRWGDLDYLEDPSAYEGIPFLVFHGTEDTTVPIATSRTFARLLPDDVALVTCPGADHIECWNVDEVRYVDEIDAFLSRVVAASDAAAA